MSKCWIIVSAVLIFVLSLLPACVGEVTPTSAPTPTHTPTGPVKISCIMAWSGEAGAIGPVADVCIDLVDYQVNELMGGILGGRKLDLIPCDTRSTTAGSVACARQALYEDDVAAAVWGGHTAADSIAIIDFCEENGLPYFFMGGIPLDICDKKYCARTTLPMESMMAIPDDVMKLLNPKTVAGLSYDTTDGRAFMSGWLERFEAAGVEVLYEDYYPSGAIDFTPYLTKIKSLDPDLIMLISSPGGYVSIAKQMYGLGGFPDTEVVCDPSAEYTMSEEGAQGWYVRTLWYPGLDTPGSKKFEEDYYALVSSKPLSAIAYMYTTLWSAISAIELAGTTDREKIAEAARSGNLVWEAPPGTFHFDTCGEPGQIRPRFMQIVDRKCIPVEIPE